MELWVIIGLICVLVMGFSISKMFVNKRDDMDSHVKTIMYICTGIIIAFVTFVLGVIAVWPPYEPLTVVLPFIFIAVLFGILYFVNNTGPKKIRNL